MNPSSPRKPHPKRSIIWKIPSEEFAKLVAAATTFTALLSSLGLMSKGGNNETVRSRCKEEGVDYSHIKQGSNSNKGRRFPNKSLTKEKALEIVFIENGPCRNSVRSYLKKYNFIPYKCECGNEGMWREKSLSLQIDHINGECRDHRLENLRWICPNCHSQTETFTGKHKKRKVRPLKPSQIDPLNYRRKPRPDKRKFLRPSKEILEQMVWEKPLSVIAKELGISGGNIIKQWCKQFKITHPTHGYWQRRAKGWSHEQSLNPPPKKIKQKPPLAIFSKEEADFIRKRLANGEGQRALAREYKVNRNVIQSIAYNPNYGTRWVKENILLSSGVNSSSTKPFEG